MPNMETYVSVTDVLARYWSAVEDFRYEDALELLDDDIEYHIGPGAKGKPQVAALLDKRPKTLHVRHFLSGFRIEESADSVDVKYNMVAFGRIAEEGEVRPFPPGTPSVIADMNISFVRTHGALKIRRVAADLIFQQAH